MSLKPATESNMRDIKASLAVEFADALPLAERVPAVAVLLNADEDEARELIARGRRLARRKVMA